VLPFTYFFDFIYVKVLHDVRIKAQSHLVLGVALTKYKDGVFWLGKEEDA
jgi:hypothetical protein